MKFSIRDSFTKYEKIQSNLGICFYFSEKLLMETSFKQFKLSNQKKKSVVEIRNVTYTRTKPPIFSWKYYHEWSESKLASGIIYKSVTCE